jgi:AmmeMemoRadiSam system protein A
MLEPEDQKTLLILARERIASELESRQPAYPPCSAALEFPAGAFVTLRMPGRQPELRGCIGRIEATDTVYETVRHVAFQAAFRDPRFPELSLPELSEVRIEISVLLPPEPVEDTEAIIPGKHGLIVSRGRQSGLLLPQVAGERNWDRTTFLEQTCRKAGLPTDAWRDPETRIETFEAFVFDEAAHSM